jgi:ribonuclease BN (tRNA processing enzyme)
MKLTILGSGTSVPHPHRASPSNWLETSKGTLLLDVGPDAPHRMAEEQLDWPNLDAIWISHFHLDHISGLTPFLWGTKWAPQTQHRTKPLRIFGPAGLRQLVDAVNDSNNYRLFEQAFPIEIVEVTPDEDFEILPNLSASTLSTPHTKESLALRLKDEDSKLFVYTSDTGFSENLALFANNAALLLMECSYRRNKTVQKHLELADAMRVAHDSAPAKVVLTHLYAQWDNIDLAAEARALWSGQTIEAKDGLRVEF